jgi:hypothetical protein
MLTPKISGSDRPLPEDEITLPFRIVCERKKSPHQSSEDRFESDRERRVENPRPEEPRE